MLPDDNIIRAAEDKVFRQYYTPARKRSTQTKAEVTQTVTPVEVETTTPTVDTSTDDFDAAFDAIAGKVGVATVAAE